MIAEKALYPPIKQLFGNLHFVIPEVRLGSRVIDVVCASPELGKLIAIELKVRDWKRALKQALVYQLCANQVYVALHDRFCRNADEDQFGRFGIGLITVGDYAKILLKAEESSRISPGYVAAVKQQISERLGQQPPGNISIGSVSQRPLKFYLWYVAIDRRYFDEYPEAYDGFVINAHILAHNASAFTALANTNRKPFFVIPETHMFQLADPPYFLDDKGGIRSSWEKVVTSYGPAVSIAIAEDRNLLIDDFLSPSGSFEQTLYQLTDNVLNFQKQRVSNALSGLSRLIELSSEQPASPTYLVAPYFYFTSVLDPWYKISFEMTKFAVARKEEHSLYAVLSMSGSLLLDERALETIATDFSLNGLDGVIIWIRDFKEEYVPVPFIVGFRKLLSLLESRNKVTINLHGGYLSILMRHFGLKGFASAVCYKESADPTEFPTGGPAGGPIPRFYYPILRTKKPKVEASLALQALPDLKCDCPVCAMQFSEMFDPATPDALSRQLMNRHFLNVRVKELTDAGTKPVSQEIKELDDVSSKYSADIGIVPVDHLIRWRDALKA